MAMVQVNLNFDGPFTFNDLVNQKEAFNPGIYIWGFKDSDSDKFIPYYVGKSLTNIVGRIALHKKDIIKDHSTYVRLSSLLMKSFYKEPKLELLIKPNKSSKNPPKWYDKHWEKEIKYINTLWFISPITNIDLISRRDYPISLLNPHPEDFLKDNIDKLLICYAVPKVEGEILTPENGIYEHIESITKCSLKGRTLGKKEKPVCKNRFIWNNNIDEYNVDFTPIDFEDIFKNDGSKVFSDDSEYPGY